MLRCRQFWMIFLVAAAINANAIFNDFVYDDVTIIRDNPLVQGPLDIPAILSTNYWLAFADRDTLYRPLAILSFALENSIFGPSPVPVHFTNIILNAVAGVLLWLVLSLVVRSQFIATAGALLFVTMPLHSEVVANGVGRSELLAAIFSLCAMLAHLRLVHGFSVRAAIESGAEELPQLPDASRRSSAFAIVSIFYFFALASKESSVLLPVLIAALDWLLVYRGDLPKTLRTWPHYVGLLVPLAGYLFLRNSVVGLAPPRAHEVMFGATVFQRVLFGLQTLLGYFHQFLIPAGFSADYHDYTQLPRPALTETLPLSSLLAWGGLLILSVAAARAGQFIPLLALIWFFVSSLATSNILVPIGTIRADRLAYFPSAAFALAGAYLTFATRKLTPHLPAVLIVAALLGQSWVTVGRNADWRTKADLWQAAVAVNPGSPDAWRNVGDIQFQEGNWQQAVESYTQTKQLKARLNVFSREAALLLAKTHTRSGNLDAAKAEYQEILAHDPKHLISMLSLGKLLLEKRETAEDALQIFSHATVLYPTNFHTWAHRAETLRKLERLDEALIDINRAIEINGTWSYVWAIKAAILQAMGRVEEAEEAQTRARQVSGKSQLDKTPINTAG